MQKNKGVADKVFRVNEYADALNLHPNYLDTVIKSAEVVYEAATDGKDQLRYVAGEDAKATYSMRLNVGDEAFRKGMDQQFFG